MGTTRVRISIDIENIDAEDEIKQREDERLAQALKYGIECSASIEELASLCFQSVSTFKRKFRARYSMSPHQWLLQQKLEIALHIIEQREISVSELTTLCGFNNTSHFIYLFRNRYGISPARLGKKLREEKNNKDKEEE